MTILVNKKHVKIIRKIFVLDRVLVVDVIIDKKNLRIISMYVQHAGYFFNDF